MHVSGLRYFAREATGEAVPGALIETYEAGTLTPKSTYQNAALTIPHATTIVCDGNGSALIFLGSGRYRFRVKRPDSSLLPDGDVDGIADATGAGAGGVLSSSEEQTVTAGDTLITLTTITYAPGTGSLHVYADGQRLSPSEYEETSSTEVTLLAPFASDVDMLFEVGTILTGGIDAGQVSYTAPGTGAVATNVQDKLEGWLSVSDYGVAPGAGDVSAGIQAALDAADAGQTVSIDLPGIYTVSQQTVDAALVIPVGVNFVMCRGAWLKMTGTGGGVVAPLGSNVLQVNIDGDGYPSSGGVPGTWSKDNAGIRCYFNASIGLGASDVVVRDSEIKNCSYGIQAYGAQRWRLYGNKVHRIKLTGMLFGYYASNDCAYNIVNANTFEDLGDYAVAFFQVGGEADGYGIHNIVSSNVARNCNLRTAGYAFGVESGSTTFQRNFAFVGNSYFDADATGTYGHGGIVISDCAESVVIGNVLNGSLGSTADFGVNCDGSINCSVVGNVINEFRGTSVFMDGSTGLLVSSNTIRDCGNASSSYGGIQVALAQTTIGATIEGNSLSWSDGYAHAGAGAVGISAVVGVSGALSRLTISNNTIHNAPQTAIGIYGTSGSKATDCVVRGNVMSGDALFLAEGFRLDHCTDAIVRDNVINDAGSASSITNSTGTVSSGNVGYVTEAKGLSSAISTGGTITHGLIATPTNISVTAAETGPTDITVSAVGGTTFAVNFGGGGSKTFYWSASV